MSLHNLSDDKMERELHRVLGQTFKLLEQVGDEHAGRLVHAVVQLRLVWDGGRFCPIPDDPWTSNSYEAIFEVDPLLVTEFTDEIKARIWDKLELVLRRHGREDVFALRVEPTVPDLPDVGPDWRAEASRTFAAVPVTNQGRRERQIPMSPTLDGMYFGSQAEVTVYEVLVKIQKDAQQTNTIAIMPVPGAKLRDAGVKTPDFVVVGNGRAAVIEVDGPHHDGEKAIASDTDRDLHWRRCRVTPVRVPARWVHDREVLEERLREELLRVLWQRP